MSISQRSDGRYIVKFKDGTKWRQKTFRAREDAEGFERSLEYDEPENSRLTVSESILLFLSRTHHCKDTENYYAMILNRMGSQLADRYVDTLDRRDLEAFRKIMRVDWHASNQSINLYVSKLLAAFRWCASEDFLDSVPWAKYRKLPEPPHGHNCGTAEDFRRIYAAATPALQWAVRTCFALCLRPGKEAERLKWSAIDLGAGRAHVSMYKVSRYKDVILPLWWVDEAKERKGPAGPNDYVCLNTLHRPWHGLGDAWRNATKRAGVQSRGPPLYTIRHMAASLMLEAGADIAAVAAQLGHKNVTTTGKYYLHAIAGAQKRAARSLPDFGAHWCSEKS